MKFGILLLAAAAGLATPAWGAPASATDAQQAALAQCVVMKTTGADRTLTAQWIFAAMAESPHIADFASLTAQRRAEINKAFAQLLTRVVTKDCIEQVKPLAAANLQSAFELVGKALGEVAMQELMNNPTVDKAIGDYTEFLSEEDFKPLTDSLEKTQSE